MTHRTLTPEENVVILSKMEKLNNILPCVKQALSDAKMGTVRVRATYPEVVGVTLTCFGTPERRERARKLMANNFCESFELVGETTTSLTYSL